MVSFIALHAPGVWQRLPPYYTYHKGQKIGRCYIDSSRFEEFVINFYLYQEEQKIYIKKETISIRFTF